MKVLIKYDIIRVDQSINNSQEKSNAIEGQNKQGGPPKNTGPGGAIKIQPPPQPIQSQSSNFLNEINKPTQPTVKPYVLGDVEDMNLPDRKYFCKIQLY